VGSEKEGNGTLEAAPGNEHPLHSAEPASQETDGSGRRADDARGQDGKHGSAPQIGGAYEWREGRAKQAEEDRLGDRCDSFRGPWWTPFCSAQRSAVITPR
jgi:hypothetical protein